VSKIQSYVTSLRSFRVWHRYLGITLLILVLISSLTGILLAWKKNVEILQPSTQKGVSKELSTWKAISELSEIAQSEFIKKYPEQADNAIDRIDVRPNKGIAKVLFEKGSWEVQIDGTSGEVKSIAKRHADWIEQLHDGSIISDLFKLVSMNILGLGLIIMLITGFWLWYAPKIVRKIKKIDN
jgi:uncharacterized iron-regulated membrane protein